MCPAGWLTFEDDCYQFNTANSQRKSWTAAKMACESFGDFSYLATIKTKEQQDFIEQILPRDRAEVWIGLSDTEQENVFKWSDKTYLRHNNYSNWLNKKRQNGNIEFKNCVLLLGQSNFAWTVGPCLRSRRYICQRKRGKRSYASGVTRKKTRKILPLSYTVIIYRDIYFDIYFIYFAVL